MTDTGRVQDDAVEAQLAMRRVGAAAPHMWHPALVGAAVRLLMDWMTNTGQIDARDALHGIEVTAPTSADLVRLGDIGEAERRAAAR